MAEPWLHVAVAVIMNADQHVLISRRHPRAHQGGLWEFPGGKVETGESVQQALCRELHEELGIEAVIGDALIQVRHHYSDKAVLLDVWRVTAFTGEAVGKEGQPLRWVTISELSEYEFPEANRPIVALLVDAPS